MVRRVYASCWLATLHLGISVEKDWGGEGDQQDSHESNGDKCRLSLHFLYSNKKTLWGGRGKDSYSSVINIQNCVYFLLS